MLEEGKKCSVQEVTYSYLLLRLFLYVFGSRSSDWKSWQQGERAGRARRKKGSRRAARGRKTSCERERSVRRALLELLSAAAGADLGWAVAV